MRWLIGALIAARAGKSHASVRELMMKGKSIYPAFKKDRELNRMYRKTLKKLLKTHGGPIARFWYLNRLIGS